MLTGVAAPSGGRVVYDGRDPYSNYAHLRHWIGVVSQDDVIHSQLSVRKALEYAALLRLLVDVRAAERSGRVEEDIR